MVVVVVKHMTTVTAEEAAAENAVKSNEWTSHSTMTEGWIDKYS